MKIDRDPRMVEPSGPVDLRVQKLRLALWIMGVGMAVALAWSAWQGWALGRGYPYNTFLFNPISRFNDWTDCLIVVHLTNPYDDPIARYPPFTWLCLRPISLLPGEVSMILFAYTGLAGIFLLLVDALRDVIPKPMSRVFLSLFAMALCFPLIFCFDRGNLELILAPTIGGAIYFIARAKYVPAMLCLVLAISLKVFPVLLLALLIRQGKMALTLIALGTFGVISLVSLWGLSVSPLEAWAFYQRNSTCDANLFVYQCSCLEGCASLWNALAILLKGLGYLGLIAPVDYSFDNPFVHRAYAVYSIGMALLALMVAIYVCLLEKEFLRCIAMLLLLLAVIVPSGGDYRLIYAGMALVALVVTRTRRPHDFTVLILLALVMVPIKEIYLDFAGKSESGFYDVPIAALLNPIFVLVAMGMLVHDSRAHGNGRWVQLRVRRLMRTLIPWLPAKSGPASSP